MDPNQDLGSKVMKTWQICLMKHAEFYSSWPERVRGAAQGAKPAELQAQVQEEGEKLEGRPRPAPSSPRATTLAQKIERVTQPSGNGKGQQSSTRRKAQAHSASRAPAIPVAQLQALG